ncbi:MAG: PfkB family carbohydrate kinase [Candidatus Omnitrophota bacterium]
MSFFDKIKKISELAEIIENLHKDRKKAILCHGVFDLLHIGHIRYLHKAKKLGDVLITTVTPDRFVNKGPHRPVFPEGLRAESLAALDFTDYVAINEWPTAEETIAALKPDVYAKGAEYRDKRTPEIMREEIAIAAVNGEIAYIEDITSSSSFLINKHFSPFPESVEQYLHSLSETYSVQDILKYLHSAKELKPLVIGETIIDQYFYCNALNISAHAPILPMKYISDEEFVGGAAAIANHLAGFCGEVGLLSMLGSEEPREDWIRQRLNKNIHPTFLRKSNSPTIVKRRYREPYFELPVFEVYTMNDEPLNERDSQTLCSRLEEMLSRYNLIIVADYGHGMIDRPAAQALSSRSNFLALLTQANAGNMGYHTISKYAKADFVCLSEEEMRLECRDRYSGCYPLVQQIAKKMQADQIAITQGKRGCTCYRKEEGYLESPALAIRVVDRVGGGDAFFALASVCAYQSAPLDILSFMGNVAGAEAVAVVGNREPIDSLCFTRHIESLMK